MFRVEVDVPLCSRTQEASGRQLAGNKVKLRASPSSVDFKIEVRQLVPTLLVPQLELRWTSVVGVETALCPRGANHSGCVSDAGNCRIPADDLKQGLPQNLDFPAAVL